jgi:hypothetical protein
MENPGARVINGDPIWEKQEPDSIRAPLRGGGDMLFAELVLAFAFVEVLGGVDEEHVVGLFALFEHEDADGDAGGVKEVGGLPRRGHRTMRLGAISDSTASRLDLSL